jgi:threonine aldolase
VKDLCLLSQLHDPHLRASAGDNYAGVHPELPAAIAVANGGHQTAYGDDVYTERLQDVVRAHFGPTAETHPVLTGTGANIVALRAMTPRWGAVLCATTSHLHTDEGVAPEAAARTKLIVVDSRDGKLTPDHIAAHASALGDEHKTQPSVVSITQATELGTVYTPQETAAVSAAAHANAMAGLLAERVRRLPGVEIVRPVQANAVFAVLPRQVIARLQKRFTFYTRDERTGEVRWMCSFDTTPDDVETFVRAITEELGAQGPDHEREQQ